MLDAGSTTADLTEAQKTFLRERPHAIVATIMPDGRPQLTPNWYLVGRRAVLGQHAGLDGQGPERQARSAGHAVHRRAGRGVTNYVQVFGTAEVVEGDVRERTIDLIRKYEPLEADVPPHWEDIKEDRVLIVVRPERFQWRFPD